MRSHLFFACITLFSIQSSLIKPALSQSNDLSQFGLGSGDWVQQYVMGRIEGTIFYTWNSTNSTLSDVKINLRAQGEVIRRDGRILSPNGNLEILMPFVTEHILSCSLALNRDTGEWIKVTANYVAPSDNYMSRLQNMESVQFELSDYELVKLPGRPSCD